MCQLTQIKGYDFNFQLFVHDLYIRFLFAKNTEGITRCMARVVLHSDGTLHRNSIDHTMHANHEAEYEDIRSANNIKMKCNLVHTEFPESSHNISEKTIFYKELAA